jgi:hypothetical protein
MSANTTVYSGNSGVVKFDVGGSATVIASVTGFTITQNADTIESSAMGSNARTYLPGMTNFSGSVDVNFIEGDAAQVAEVSWRAWLWLATHPPLVPPPSSSAAATRPL